MIQAKRDRQTYYETSPVRIVSSNISANIEFLNFYYPIDLIEYSWKKFVFPNNNHFILIAGTPSLYS